METTKESGWECTHCQKIFKHRSVYANHLVIHDPNSQVQCNVSMKKFLEIFQLSKYIMFSINLYRFARKF